MLGINAADRIRAVTYILRVRISGDPNAQLLRRMAVRQRRERLMFLALAVFAVIGGLNAIFGVLFGKGPQVEPEAGALRQVGHAELVGSFAADFVERYLGAAAGSERMLTKYVALPQTGLPSQAREVSEPSVVYLERTQVAGSVEIWSATVSVRLGDTGANAAQRQYYRVGVSLSAGRVRALAVPDQVAPPDRGLDLSLGYPSSCSPRDPLYTVTSGFLTAMLAGAGDVSRYTTANAGLAALTPAPASSVDTNSVASDNSSCGAQGSTAHVLATVTPHTSGAAWIPLSYPLTLVRDSGQWQVSGIDPVPALTTPLAVVANAESNPGALSGSAAPTTTAAGADQGGGAGDSNSDAAIPPATHN
jgi:hypothetical protein